MTQALAELQQQRQVAFALMLPRPPPEAAVSASQENQPSQQAASSCTEAASFEVRVFDRLCHIFEDLFI